MNKTISLDNINIGQSAIVESLKNTGTIRRRLLDIGITEGATIKCVGKSPWDDPGAYLIRGAIIAIRKEDSKNILIHLIPRGDENGAD